MFCPPPPAGAIYVHVSGAQGTLARWQNNTATWQLGSSSSSSSVSEGPVKVPGGSTGGYKGAAGNFMTQLSHWHTGKRQAAVLKKRHFFTARASGSRDVQRNPTRFGAWRSFLPDTCSFPLHSSRVQFDARRLHVKQLARRHRQAKAMTDGTGVSRAGTASQARADPQAGGNEASAAADLGRGSNMKAVAKLDVAKADDSREPLLPPFLNSMSSPSPPFPSLQILREEGSPPLLSESLSLRSLTKCQNSSAVPVPAAPANSALSPNPNPALVSNPHSGPGLNPEPKPGMNLAFRSKPTPGEGWGEVGRRRVLVTSGGFLGGSLLTGGQTFAADSFRMGGDAAAAAAAAGASPLPVQELAGGWSRGGMTPGAHPLRHVIITGGNSGIGKAMGTALAARGMAVTLACRSGEKGAAAAAKIASASASAHVTSMVCDLASLRSVRAFAQSYVDTGRPLHALVDNAGVMACPQSYTCDGFETHFGVNHMGHFALTNLLLPLLARSASPERQSRVVVVTSAAEQIGTLDFADLNYKGSRGYNPWLAYGQSKLANCLFTLELASRCRAAATPVTANCFHPGIVDTELIRYVMPAPLLEARNATPGASAKFARLIGLRSPEEGAATGVHLVCSPLLEGASGGYYEDCTLKKPSGRAQDAQVAGKLWRASEELARGYLCLGSNADSSVVGAPPPMAEALSMGAV